MIKNLKFVNCEVDAMICMTPGCDNDCNGGICEECEEKKKVQNI